MSNLSRVTQKTFGLDGGAESSGVFGSLAAGTPTYSLDPATIQSLANFGEGWSDAVLGENSPAIEDMNGLFILVFYQLAYLMQKGVPEYDAATTYYSGSICSSGGKLFVSQADTNLGNALTSSSWWALYGSKLVTKTANYTATQSDDIIMGDATTAAGFNVTITLPAVASTPVGKKYTVKNVSTSPGCTVTMKGNAAEIIEGANTYVLQPAPPVAESLTVVNNGTQWMII